MDRIGKAATGRDERAGDLVTKEELFARIWPSLSVDKGILKTQVALLRKTLRDGISVARYVITVPGRGYRFVAPLTQKRRITLGLILYPSDPAWDPCRVA